MEMEKEEIHALLLWPRLLFVVDVAATAAALNVAAAAAVAVVLLFAAVSRSTRE